MQRRKRELREPQLLSDGVLSGRRVPWCRYVESVEVEGVEVERKVSGVGRRREVKSGGLGRRREVGELPGEADTVKQAFEKSVHVDDHVLGGRSGALDGGLDRGENADGASPLMLLHGGDVLH